jgi:hypothetical protein
VLEAGAMGVVGSAEVAAVCVGAVSAIYVGAVSAVDVGRSRCWVLEPWAPLVIRRW